MNETINNVHNKVLLIGAGPIMIGQGSETDYAGVTAIRTLLKAGCEVVLLGGNPALLTAAEKAKVKVYYEPIILEVVQKIIIQEKIDSVLVGFGGQTALNIGYYLAENRDQEKDGCRLLDVSHRVISQIKEKTDFEEILLANNLKTPAGKVVNSSVAAVDFGKQLPFPLVTKSLFALEGEGVLIAYNFDELMEYVARGLALSPVKKVRVESSFAGWQEIEVEALRDADGQTLIVAVMENLEAVGVHSGNSILITPALTVPKEQQQRFIELSRKIMESFQIVGLANLQFAYDPFSKEIVLLEVNPRFTASAVLAEKQTGLSLAETAVKLALGAKLTELIDVSMDQNGLLVSDDPGQILMKMPRFDFAKFKIENPHSHTLMQATGGVITVGYSFGEILQKGMRSLKNPGFGLGIKEETMARDFVSGAHLRAKLINPNPERLFYIRLALKRQIPLPEIAELTKINEWYISQIKILLDIEKEISTYAAYNLKREILATAKQAGFADGQIGALLRTTAAEICRLRQSFGIIPQTVIKKAALSQQELYRFTTYAEAGARKEGGLNQPKILFLGASSHGIGQGREKEGGLIRGAHAITDLGYAAVIITPLAELLLQCNDSQLTHYQEPLTGEDVLDIINLEAPEGVIGQFGNAETGELTEKLEQAGIRILDAYPGWLTKIYEIKQRLLELLNQFKINLLESRMVNDLKSVETASSQIGFPLIAQKVNAAKTKEVVGDYDELLDFLEHGRVFTKDQVWLEKYPENALGIAVDILADGEDCVICGIFEQIEEAGVHFGDAAASFPPYTLSSEVLKRVRESMVNLVGKLRLKGLYSFRFAWKEPDLYLREIWPGLTEMTYLLSEILPFAWPEAAVKALLGIGLQEQNLLEGAEQPTGLSIVKEAVFSFNHFPGIDTVLGPHRRSVGFAVGVDQDFGMAFIKAQLAAGEALPLAGKVYLSIQDEEKRPFLLVAKELFNMGFELLAPEDTADFLRQHQLPCEMVLEPGEGRPDILDRLKNGEVQWIINIAGQRKSLRAEVLLRSTAVARKIPIITTLSGAQALVAGLEGYLNKGLKVH